MRSWTPRITIDFKAGSDLEVDGGNIAILAPSDHVNRDAPNIDIG